MKNNKSIFLGVLVLVVVGAGAAYFYFSKGTQPPSLVSSNTANTAVNKTSEWKWFISDNDDFKVLFPETPKHEVATSTNPYTKIDRYSVMKSGQRGLIYGVDVMDYPVTRDAKKNLMDVLSVVILPSQQNLVPNTSLLTSQFTMFFGYEALDYTIGINNEKGHLRGRIVFEDVAGKLYSVHVLYGTQVDEDDFGKFISSFQLIQI